MRGSVLGYLRFAFIKNGEKMTMALLGILNKTPIQFFSGTPKIPVILVFSKTPLPFAQILHPNAEAL